MLPEQGGLNRHYYFGKYLKRLGHEPIVFVGSHPHNTNLQLINGKEKYEVYQEEPFPWILVKTCDYEGSKVKRVFSMFQYYFNAKKAAKEFGEPDAIIGSTAHPLAALLAIKLGKKYGCKKIVEVRDLWPESIVAFGIMGKNNLIIRFLYRFEKWLYMNADDVIFTMEGGYDYIKKQRWDKEIPIEKVHYLNNGVDMELFSYNKEHYQIDDADLKNENTFKVIYTGSVKMANGLEQLVECASYLQDKNIVFLVYGNGDYLNSIRELCKKKGIRNVKLKGRIEKKYIPYILSKGNLNMLNYNTVATAAGLYRYGSSQNKIFDYLASGKPIISNSQIAYDIISKNGCGVSKNLKTGREYAEEVLKVYSMQKIEYEKLCENAEHTAEQYSFEILAEKLVRIIEDN